MGKNLFSRCYLCFFLVLVFLLFFLPHTQARPSDHLLVSEVFYDAPGDDSAEEWIEIYNPTAGPIDVSRWKITDGETTFTLPNDLMMAAGEVLVLARNGVGFSALYGFAPDLAGLNLSLSNSGDEVVLKNLSGTVIDAVVYENGSYPGVVPHPGVATGHSIERVFADFDTDDCSRDFIDQAEEAPGVVKLDTSPPVARAGGDRLVDEDKEVVFDGSASTDDGLIVSYRWDFGDGTTASGKVAVHTFAEPGVYQVRLTVTDSRGNIGEDVCRLEVQDRTAPSGSIFINAGSPVTRSRTVRLSLEATDNSRLAEMVLSNQIDFSGATWEPFGSSKDWELSSDEGTKTVFVKFRDGSGNESTVSSSSILLDASPPILTGLNIAEGQTIAGVYLIKVEATDISGIQSVDFYIDEKLKMSDTAFPFEYSWDTTRYHSSHTLKIVLTDRASNTLAVSRTVYVRNLPYTSGVPLLYLIIAGLGALTLGLLLRQYSSKTPSVKQH